MAIVISRPCLASAWCNFGNSRGAFSGSMYPPLRTVTSTPSKPSAAIFSANSS